MTNSYEIADIIDNFSESEAETSDSDEDIEEFEAPECPTTFECSVGDQYVLNIAATRNSNPNVAVGLSNNEFKVYKLDQQLQETDTLTSDLGKPIHLKFSNENDNLLWTGFYNGAINLWDLRTPQKPSQIFTDTTDDKVEKDKKFNTFDISSNNRLLCAGTDLFEGDSFILFWDARKTNLLGGFWESHVDDITQVQFHPSDPNTLISGSTDGIINIYNLKESQEEDALIDTLNSNDSIEKLNWSKFKSDYTISCMTHTAEVQLWKTEDAEPFLHFKRKDIATKIKKKSETYTYVAGVHTTEKLAIIIVGSNVHNGECARILNFQKLELQPAFNLTQNRQRIRSSWLNENNHFLLTGGESGIINVWNLEAY